MAGATDVPQRCLHRICPTLMAAPHVGHPDERIPDVDEAIFIVRGFQHRQRLPCGAVHLVGRTLAGEPSRQRGVRACERCVDRVFRCCRAFGGCLGNHGRSSDVGPIERVCEFDLETEIEPIRTHKRECTVKQPDCRPPVAAPECTFTRDTEMIPAGDGNLRFLPSSAVSRGSNACTGAHALNQATPSRSGTRSTFAQGRSCVGSMTPTGSTCARIQSSAARSTLPLCRRAAGARPAASDRERRSFDRGEFGPVRAMLGSAHFDTSAEQLAERDETAGGLRNPLR